MTTTAVEPGTAAPARRLPGQTGMWVFVVGDLWIFLGYFACYAHDRAHQPTFLAAQQHLSQGIGLANTLLLLTSSLCVALAVQQVRVDARAAASRLLLAATACGVLFLVLKGFEWVPHVRAGDTIGSGRFWLYYYMLTGLHVLHVLLGLGLLTWLRRKLPAPGPLEVGDFETGATYWHMVDLLWIVLFALFYLMR